MIMKHKIAEQRVDTSINKITTLTVHKAKRVAPLVCNPNVELVSSPNSESLRFSS
jgi:hypothetical protein